LGCLTEILTPSQPDRNPLALPYFTVPASY
jgi:hypothetical protein